MSSLFADTSGWGCLVDPTQLHHTLAVELYGMREALTTDRHFEQAGFIRLLK
jgi:predicted nucleic acid-binding protein